MLPPRSLPAFLILLAGMVSVQPVPAQVQAGSVVDGIAAVVGGEVILRSEVDALAQQMAAQNQQAGVSDALWSRALDQLVNQRVLIVKAQQDTTLQVPDAYIDQQLDAQVNQLVQQAGGEQALEQAYGRSIDEIRTSFRPDLRKQILASQFRSNHLRDVTITPAEVREWFDRIPQSERPEVPELVRVAHVVKLPTPDESAQRQAREFAQALRDSIASDEATIEDLARRYSQDPGSAQRGGLIENIRVGDLVSEFGAIAAQMEPGDLSQPFGTAFGIHVMRLNERSGDRISFNHILIPIEVTEDSRERLLTELSTLRDSVTTMGVPFEAIAKRHSEDPMSKARSGYVTDPRTGERDLRTEALGPQWQATLDTLQVGQVSRPAPVQLLDGTDAYHIVLLQKRTEPHTLSVENDYLLLSEYALQEKQQRILSTWVRRLRRDVYVDIRSDRYVDVVTPQTAQGG